MTKAVFGKNGDHFIMRVDGHADHGPKEHDIVCSAMSMLAQTMLRWVDDNRDLASAIDVYEYRDGYVAVEFWSRPDQTQPAAVALEVIEGGFRMLAERYPEHVWVGEHFFDSCVHYVQTRRRDGRDTSERRWMTHRKDGRRKIWKELY